MKTFQTVLLIALSMSGAMAQVAALVGSGKSQPALIRKPIYHNHPLTPLLYEDFENPDAYGYDLVGWAGEVIVPGVINPNYTATVLFGNQSLLLDEANDDPVYTTNSFTATDHIWTAFMFRPTNIPDSADTSVIRFTAANDACQFRFTLNSDGEPRVQFGCSGSAFGTTATMAVNTTYIVWIEYDNDNGANAVLTLAFSTNGIRPTSGDNFVTATGAQTATQASRVMIGRPGSENGSEIDFIIDHLLVDDVQINDWP